MGRAMLHPANSQILLLSPREWQRGSTGGEIMMFFLFFIDSLQANLLKPDTVIHFRLQVILCVVFTGWHVGLKMQPLFFAVAFQLIWNRAL